MGRVADMILDAMAAEVETRQEWDEPPALCLLYLDEGKCRARPVLVPDQYWAAAPPSHVLAAIADGLGGFSGLLRSVAPEGLHGAAFRCEMWQVSGAEGDTAALAEAEAAARARRLHAHPGRVEVRSMWAVDRGGASYDVTLARVTGEVRRSVSYPKPGVPGMTGTIPDALDKLVTVLTGAELAARPR